METVVDDEGSVWRQSLLSAAPRYDSASLEEKMRRLMKEEVVFQPMEMMPDNAGQFLVSLGRSALPTRFRVRLTDRDPFRSGDYANFSSDC